MTRVAIIAAMAGELKPLVRGWERVRRSGVDLWRWKFNQGEWVAACAGAGVDAATRAFAEIEKDGAVDSVFSIGWAGALSEDFLPGRAYPVSGIIDVRTGERFRTTGEQCECWLATSDRVADEREKRRLAVTYGASFVDMEAAAVARLTAMRGIPFFCLKGVSDSLSDKLPDFNRFISKDGQFKLPMFILFVLFRPWYWSALMRMGENSRKAARGIRDSLLEYLQRQDDQGALENRNGYTNIQP
jgi:adenosylhomocysteine nucleosidase